MRALERGQAGDAVLDFLHRGQHDAPVVGDRRVVAGLREIDVGAGAGRRRRAAACSDDAERPDAGSARRTASTSERLSKPTRGAERDARIERGAGDADLRVGRRHRALGRGDVGPALEDVGRHAERHRRRRERAAGRARARTAAPACRSASRSRARTARAAGAAGRPASACCRAAPAAARRRGPEAAPRSWRVGHELERAPLQGDRARQHVELDVDRAQVEVRGGEVGRQQQPGVLEIGRRLLGATRARLRSCAARGRRGRARS